MALRGSTAAGIDVHEVSHAAVQVANGAHKYVVFELHGNSFEVDVEGSKAAHYTGAIAALPRNQCRFVLYNFGKGKKSKLIWAMFYPAFADEHGKPLNPNTPAGKAYTKNCQAHFAAQAAFYKALPSAKLSQGQSAIIAGDKDQMSRILRTGH